MRGGKCGIINPRSKSSARLMGHMSSNGEDSMSNNDMIHKPILLTLRV